MFEDITTVFLDVGDTFYICPPMEEEYSQRLVQLLSTSRNMAVADAEHLLAETVRALERKCSGVTKVRAMEELGFTRSQVHAAFCQVNPSDYLFRDPTIASLLRVLTHSYRLGLVSNFQRVHLDHILAAIGLSSNYFGCGIVSEDVVRQVKPAREPFLKAVELSRDQVDHCLFVGDSPTKDMRPAKEIGMATVLVKTSPANDDLAFADACVTDLRELPLLLPKITVYSEGSAHGRFQPPHNEHLEYLLRAKHRCEFLWVGITRPDVRSRLSCSEAPHRSEQFANPLTFFERVQIITEILLDAGVPRQEFACVPFPIDEAELLPAFTSRAIPCFTTIYDAWNRTKVERLQSLGHKVIVLKEAPQEEKRIRGETIRANIRDGGREWELSVPPATRRAVYRLNLQNRLASLAAGSE